MHADEIEVNSGSRPLCGRSCCRSRYDLPIAMRRPFRTRRLSIAAIVSLLAFGAVVGAGVRSCWVADGWDFGNFHVIRLESGGILYQRLTGSFFSRQVDKSGPIKQTKTSGVFWKFAVDDSTFQIPGGESARIFLFVVPLWPLLLLLLIAPARWLIARPADAPAFPVIRHE